MKSFTPINTGLLVKKLTSEETKTKSGLILVENEKDHGTIRAQVLCSDSEESKIKPGDIVHIPALTGFVIETDQECLWVKLEHVLVIEKKINTNTAMAVTAKHQTWGPLS